MLLNSNSYAYYSSVQGQPLASLRCQVTASMVCFPFFPLLGSWATLSPASMDCILGPRKLVLDQPPLKNITSLLWRHHTAYVGSIKGTTIAIKEQHWHAYNKTFLPNNFHEKSHDRLNRGPLKGIGCLFPYSGALSLVSFLSQDVLSVMSLIQIPWIHGMQGCIQSTFLQWRTQNLLMLKLDEMHWLDQCFSNGKNGHSYHLEIPLSM